MTALLSHRARLAGLLFGRTVLAEEPINVQDDTAKTEEQWIAEAVPQSLDGYYHETYRPQFHFTSCRYWMNDPNGLVYFERTYHLFCRQVDDGSVRLERLRRSSA